jgi:hypothetical protein
MKKKLIILLPCLLAWAISSAQIITDTIFFNSAWQICEQPMASYYRIGTLHTDSNWHYSGDFKDYNLDNQLLFEGHYDSSGKNMAVLICTIPKAT